MQGKQIASGVLAVWAALVVFCGTADASIVTTGNVTTPLNEPNDYTISSIYRIAQNSPGTLTIDNGSKLAQTDSIMLMGHGALATVTIASGGWFESTTNDGEDGGNYITVGNYDSGDVTVTGSGSKMTCLGKIRVGRRSFVTPSYLTIEDGGLVKAKMIQFGDYLNATGYVHMATSGMLAIEGNKTLAGMATVGSGSGEIRYWNGSWWDRIANATEGPKGDYTLTYYEESTLISGVDVNGFTVLAMTESGPTAMLIIIR